MRKQMLSLLFLLLLINVNVQAFISSNELPEDEYFSFSVSEPIISLNQNNTIIKVPESDSSIAKPGYPDLPKITKTIILPFGTTISSLTLKDIVVREKTIVFPLNITPLPEQYTNFDLLDNEDVSFIQNLSHDWSEGWYPLHWFDYHVGGGLQNNTRVTFLTITMYPVRYCQEDNMIEWIEFFDFHLTFDTNQNIQTSKSEETIDLVIIGPESFSSPVESLLTHKKQIGLSAQYTNLSSIYGQYTGRDEAEKIKYYIEDMVSTHDTSFVLIMGSIYRVPIRTSYTSIFGRWEHPVLSDLYYADLYFSDGSFSSWDSNNDGVYGETDVDNLDLYPDVHVGRLPCETVEEVSLVVNKIMVYEQNTFGEDWYNDMIFIGGNTFPGLIFQRENEGEKHNQLIMSIMDDFTPSAVIWTSKGNFNPVSINRAINKGAGFVDYSGHGFEHGMGTYKPHGRRLKAYLTPYVSFLKNGYELPVIFFDACLTAKLDFVFQDVLDYKQYRLFDIAFRLAKVNTSFKLPCFAWSFVKHDRGGAIATIGATRTAFGGEDFGCEKLSTEFFSSYRRGTRLGPMLSAAQTAYIHDLPDDQFTVEEFVLLGDPSLILGGYSDDVDPPKITIVNPVNNAIHLFGISLFPRLLNLNETRVYGGFRKKPVQVLVEDDVDIPEDINVYIKVNNNIDTKLVYNKRSGYHEISWTGFGWNTFTMNITGIDRSGNEATVSQEITYRCLFPLFN